MRIRKLVVVGASLAGLRAAQAARKDGFDGDLVLVGGESRVPYDRPPLSKSYLADDSPDEAVFHSESHLRDDLGIDLRLGTWAIGLNIATRRVWLDSGDHPEDLDFDALVIASGASPRQLPGTARVRGVHALRTLDDANAIRTALESSPRTVVIGAGFIGSEVASTIRSRNLPVTLLEAAPVPLARSLGVQVGAECARLHHDNGTDLRCGTAVTELEDDGQRVRGVRLESGETLPAELVISATGVTPNTAWLRGSGIALHHRDGGVLCDAALNVGIHGIYAGGDVAHVPHALVDGATLRVEHWTNASEQGALAAHNALHPEAATPAESVPYFWSDWYERRIQFVGVPDADEIRVISEEKKEEKYLALYRRGERIIGCMGVDRAGQVMRYQRLIAKARPWAEALELAKV